MLRTIVSKWAVTQMLNDFARLYGVTQPSMLPGDHFPDSRLFNPNHELGAVKLRPLDEGGTKERKYSLLD